jgi:hypothetical protein
MANGSKVETLTPQSLLLSHRKRSRSQLDPESIPQKRKEKDKEKDKEDNKLLLVAAINQSIEARKSSIIRAIEILVQEFKERVTETDFFTATDILSNEVKASVFITLPKDIRDRWLEREASIIVLSSID